MELRSYPGESGSFPPVVKTSQLEKIDQETETEEIEYFSQGAGQPLPKNKKIQLEISSKIKVGEVDLTDFLQRSLPIMLDQLGRTTKAFSYYEVEWGADNDLNTVIKSLPEHELQVSCIAWNPRGTVLALGYAYPDHIGWCPHKSILSTWTAFKEQRTSNFEVDSCISALAFHPLSPQKLVAGTFNGQLLLFDLEKQDSLVSMSSIDEYQHREAITALQFANPYSGTLRLYSISTDGKILQWNPNNLQFPIRGFLLRNKSELQGGLSLTFPTGDPDSLMVGTEGGKVLRLSLPEINNTSMIVDGMKWKEEAEMVLNNLELRYRPQAKLAAERYADILGLKEVTIQALFACKLELLRMYPSPINFTYERHDGPVKGIECNPFHRSLFATCGSDGTGRLYHYTESKPLIEIEPMSGKRLTCLAWSLTRPLVMAVGCENGKVYIYDFLQSLAAPVARIGQNKHSVTEVVFNGSIKDLMAVSYASGVVEVVQIAPTFSTPHPDEQRRLQALFRQVSD